MKEKYFVIEWSPTGNPAFMWFTNLEEARKFYRECVKNPGEECEYYLCKVLDAVLVANFEAMQK